MKLKAIELKGFKSFADRTRIEFLDGVTCIVGPNGCGKSNITDAIRWVLGEQSSGSLRATKMEDVIFNGTSHRAPLHFSEVSLIFDEAEELLEAGQRELSIKRLLHRSGESSYYINGDLVRLKDVKELLMDTGIGVSGYSLISQGDIEDILKDSKFNRRKIFEEASGISLFDFKKREAERKLFRVEENLTRIRDIFQEIDQRMEPLEDASTKAKRYLELKENYRRVHVHFFLQDYENHGSALKELEGELVQIKNDLTKNETRDEEVKKERHELQEAMEKLKAEEDLLEDLYKEKREAREEILIDVKLTEQRLLQKSDELPEIERNVLSHEEKILRIKDEIIANEKRLKKQEEAKEKDEETLQALTLELKLIRDQLEQTQSRSTDVNKRRHDLEVGLSQQKETLHFLQEELEIEEVKKEELKTERKEHKQERRLLEDQSLAHEESLDELSTKLLKITDDIKSKEDNLKSLQDLLEEKEEAIHEKELIQRKLETELSMIDSFSKEAKERNEENLSILAESFKGKELGMLLDKLTPKKGYESAASSLLDFYLNTIIIKGHPADVSELSSSMKHDARLFFSETQSNRISLEEDHIPFADILSFKHKDETWIKGLFSSVAYSEKAPDRAYPYTIVTKNGTIYYADGSLQITPENKENKSFRDSSETFEGLRSTEEDIFRLKDEEEVILSQVEEEETAIEALEIKQQEIQEEIGTIRAKLSDVKESLGMIYFKEKQLKSTAEHLESSSQSKEIRIEKILESIKEKSDCLQSLLDIEVEEDPGELRLRYNEKLEAQTEARIKLTKLEENYHHEVRGLRGSKHRLSELDESLEELMKRKEEHSSLISELQEHLDEKRENQGVIQEEMSELQNQLQLLKDHYQSLENKRQVLETEREELSVRLSELRNDAQRLEINEVRLQEKMQTITTELWNQYELSIFAAKQEWNPESAYQRKELKNLSLEMLALEPVNLGAIKEYEEVKERHGFLKEQMGDLETSKRDIEKSIRTLEKTMLASFKKTFEDIKMHFSQVFCELFQGGTGDIRLADEENILESDINILASPPGKKLTHMSLLSGGEKALTAIALLFSVLRAKPAPFYVLDEIEAALDDFNISRFGSFLEEFSKGSQFIIITHRKGTMQFAKALYGVSMEEKGVSNVISLKIKENDDA